ncbi:MAG: anthranilate synthase component I family protein, partial [Deltaproteobacteria bacterium]|nr:anthranilate synthase component I family protein [Deltaproteobacteria bacterium]
MRITPVGNITPVSVFSAIRGLPMPFMFNGKGAANRRYSFIGAAPFAVVKTDKGGTTVDGAIKKTAKDPFEAISEILARFKSSGKSPFPFNGGAAGYFAYDLKNILFKKLTTSPAGGLGLPLCIAGFYDTVYAYDHMEKKGYIITHGIDEKTHRLMEDSIRTAKEIKGPEIAPATVGFQANITKDLYLDSIRKAQAYIAEGDIYQINLSQRLEISWKGDPFALYTKLLNKKPAPFSSFFDFRDFQIISNSPERLLAAKGGYVETSPIKGTRPRGATPDEDKRLIEALRKSPKERAEHVMIVDLERSDIGQVALPGTVEVAEFEAIETFPGLHHLISTVRGKKRPDITPAKCLKAVFPGGSVTGAPKIRAMEIIEELETMPREIYTGGIGWIGFDDNM